MAKNLIFVTIGILLGVNNIFVNFKIAGISYDRILEFIIFLIFIRTYLRYLREDVFFSRLNIFIGVLSVLQLIVNVRLAIVDNLDIEYVLRDLVKGFTFVVFSFLFLLLIKKNFRFVNIIIGVHILVCLFGLMLHPMSPLLPSQAKKSACLN